MSHLSIIEDCDKNYQQIDDEEFERIETEYLKYQIGGDDLSLSDKKNLKKLFYTNKFRRFTLRRNIYFI